MKHYAGIGSRETPPDILNIMVKIGKRLAKEGYTLRSGGAVGADKAFEQGCDLVGGQKEIFYADQNIPIWADLFTNHFHPAPDRLGEYPRKLMSRNAMQILGGDGDTPVQFVVCWTKGGKLVGGTAQAIRIADWVNVPVFNLGQEGRLDEFREFVKGM